jgi:hypothetical protein
LHVVDAAAVETEKPTTQAAGVSVNLFPHVHSRSPSMSLQLAADF